MSEKKELNFDELEKVNGGDGWWEEDCSTPEKVKFQYQVGDHVELIWASGWLTGHDYTRSSTITDRGAYLYGNCPGYGPCYYVKTDDNKHDDDSGWYAQNNWNNDHKVTPVKTGM